MGRDPRDLNGRLLANTKKLTSAKKRHREINDLFKLSWKRRFLISWGCRGSSSFIIETRLGGFVDESLKE